MASYCSTIKTQLTKHKTLLQKFKWEFCPHSLLAHSLDLLTCDFHFEPTKNDHEHFRTDHELKLAALNWVENAGADFTTVENLFKILQLVW